MSERQFKKKLEKKLHFVALIFPISMVVISVIILEINPSRQGTTMCSSSPGENPAKKNLVPVFIGFCFLSGLVGMIVATVKLFLAVRVLERRMVFRYRSSITERRGSSGLTAITDAAAIVIAEIDDTNTRNTIANQSADPVSPTHVSKLKKSLLEKLSRRGQTDSVALTRSQMKSRARTRKVLVQTVLYIAVFLITSIWPIVILVGFLSRGVNPPVAIDIIFKFVYPCNGILILLVFTRSKVATVLERWEGYSRARAFWVVVKAGFEVPSNCVKIESDEENAQQIREPNAAAGVQHEASEDNRTTHAANLPISGMPSNVATAVDLKSPPAAIALSSSGAVVIEGTSR